jgi:hypothetical protein
MPIIFRANVVKNGKGDMKYEATPINIAIDPKPIK